MQKYLVGLVITGILFAILQNVDNKNNQRKQIPPSSNGKKIAIFIVVLILVQALVYWFWSDGRPSILKRTTHGGGADVPHNVILPDKVTLEKNMLKNIHEDVFVGSGPFTVMRS